MKLTVAPVTPDRWSDLEAVFNAKGCSVARGCWCSFDSGFHRQRWFKEWMIRDYLRPDEAVRLAGVNPEEVTDVVISHAHWDHMGGIDLFPRRTCGSKKTNFAVTRETPGSRVAITAASIPTTFSNSCD